MHSRLHDFDRLTIAERIQLVEDLWDSISQAEEVLDLTDAQRRKAPGSPAMDGGNGVPGWCARTGGSWGEPAERIISMSIPRSRAS